MMRFLLKNVDTKTLIIVIVCAVLAVAIGVVIYLFGASHTHIKKAVADITKKYDQLHNLLTTQIAQELKKVGSIASMNIEYESKYDSNRNMYNEISENEDALAHESINKLNRMIVEKKYNLIKDEIEVAKTRLSNFETRFNQLNKCLEEITTVDEENHQEILRYKRQYREIKDIYNNKKNELKYVESSFDIMFDKIDQMFIDSENLLSGAHYEKSKEQFPTLEKILYEIRNALDYMPKLVITSFVVIPSSIKEMLAKANQLTEQNYPLHHLRVQANVENFQQQLSIIQEKLKKFQYKNLNYDLSQIREAILNLNNSFDNEVASCTYFNENFESLYKGSYKLTNRFIKLKRVIPTYKTTYILRDEYIDELNNIQSKIDGLDTTKRILDTYVHASSKQPYSVLADRLKELDNQMKMIDDQIQNVQAYLTSLKRDLDEGYQYITEIFLVLKKEESKLRTLNVTSCNNLYLPQINQCYALLSECGVIIKKLPIDVDQFSETLQEVRVRVEKIFADTSKISEVAHRAEEALVYANQYRHEFYDVQLDLQKAELAFFEGDFTRTSDISVSIIKKFSAK